NSAPRSRTRSLVLAKRPGPKARSSIRSISSACSARSAMKLTAKRAPPREARALRAARRLRQSTLRQSCGAVATQYPARHGPRALAALRIPSLAIFRRRQFVQYWIGRWFATLAVQIQATAMGWQVYDAARSHGQSVAEAAFLLGLVGLAQFLPLLVLSLFGGQAADRYNRRLILVGCISAKAAIAL